MASSATALYYAFLAPTFPLPSRTNRAVYFISVDKFMAEQYDDAFHYDWLSKRIAKVLGDQDAICRAHLPLAVVGAGGWGLPNWVQVTSNTGGPQQAKPKAPAMKKRQNRPELHAANAKAFGEHLRGIHEQYQISHRA
ncbi:MAG: hypothetical protein R3D67_18775 [Hyphomicrobiaceae bacterium]